MHRESDLPDPLGIEAVKPPSWIRRVVAVLLVGAVISAAMLVPIPIFYAYVPGPVRDVEKLVEVSGAEIYSSEGSLFMTTVSLDIHVTLVDWAGALFDPTTDIVMKEAVTGGRPFSEVEKQQIEEMRMSKAAAEEVAFSALGLGSPTGDGARIQEVAPETPAAEVLRKGDVILKVDGQDVSTTCDVGRRIKSKEPGERVEVTVRRNGSVKTVTVGTIPNPQDPDVALIGIFMADVNREFDPGVDVEFKTGDVAGPSAGLMLSLALYDRLTPDDVTGGRSIAGTGTIACDGAIGAIGGIEQKVAGAESEGAEIFLSPAANYEAATAAADDIEVVKVSTFSEALRFLEGLEQG
ncbi:MAG: YlbL family protein [Actinomycetota bacterium]